MSVIGDIFICILLVSIPISPLLFIMYDLFIKRCFDLVERGYLDQDTACFFGAHEKDIGSDMCHHECSNCHKIWYENPYMNT